MFDFLGNINKYAEKFKNKKIIYMVFALIIAVTLWVYVTQSSNPLEEKLYEIPVEYNNLPSTMAVLDKTDTVKVRIQGYSGVLENIDTKDITATVDLSNANIGQYVAKINIELPSGVQLISVTPLDVEVDIQEMVTVEVPVEIDISEVWADDGCRILTPVAMTDVVSISGAKDNVAKISKAVVMVPSAKLSQSYSGTLPVLVYDKYGGSLEGLVKVWPETIDVMVPVIGDAPSKVAPISANLVGSPAQGYAVSRIIVSPNIVTAYAGQTLLDSIDYIYTEAIDISGAKGDITAKAGLIADDGIRLDIENEVDVLIQIEKTTTRVFDNVQIKLTNSDSGYKYILSSDMVSVKVSGPESVMESLTANNISVEADMAGLKNGYHSVKLTYSIPGASYVESITPSTVTVYVKQ